MTRVAVLRCEGAYVKNLSDEMFGLAVLIFGNVGWLTHKQYLVNDEYNGLMYSYLM